MVLMVADDFNRALRGIGTAAKKMSDSLFMQFNFPSYLVAARLHSLASNGISLESSIVVLKLEKELNINEDELQLFKDLINSI